jgi:hypothetical protein
MQTLLPVALTIAQGVAQAVGERQAAKGQEQQNQQLRQSALETRERDLQAIEARRVEEREAASQQLQGIQAQAIQERSQALAASSAAGQSGLSVRALLSDSLRQYLDGEQAIQTNLSNLNSQLDRERKAVVDTAKSRINMATPAVYPSYFVSGLKIGANAYSTYQATKPPPKPSTNPQGVNLPR